MNSPQLAELSHYTALQRKDNGLAKCAGELQRVGRNERNKPHQLPVHFTGFFPVLVEFFESRMLFGQLLLDGAKTAAVAKGALVA